SQSSARRHESCFVTRCERPATGRLRTSHRTLDAPRGTRRSPEHGWCLRLSMGGVYVIVGAFALMAAADPRRQPTDSVGAFRHLVTGQLGLLLAGAVVCGLLADTVWQSMRALGPAHARGWTGRALLQRASWLGSGV